MKYVFFIGLVVASFGVQVSLAQNSQAAKLANIRKIYIASLGNEEGSDLVREQIRLRLVKTERFSVVERPESADAVLTGVAGVARSTSGLSTNSVTGAVSGGRTDFSGVGVLRLVDTKTDETLWVYEYKSSGFSLSASSGRVADKTVDQLLKDAKPPSKKK